MTAREVWRRDPTQVLTRAVEGMLPKNNLQPDRMRKLRVFVGPDHPFGATPMVPWRMPPKLLEDHKLGWGMPVGFVPMNPEAYAKRMHGARRVAGWPPAAAGEAVAAAGQQQQQGRTEGPLIGFDDLLAADERQFIEQCKIRAASKKGR